MASPYGRFFNFSSMIDLKLNHRKIRLIYRGLAFVIDESLVELFVFKKPKQQNRSIYLSTFESALESLATPFFVEIGL